MRVGAPHRRLFLMRAEQLLEGDLASLLDDGVERFHRRTRVRERFCSEAGSRLDPDVDQGFDDGRVGQMSFSRHEHSPYPRWRRAGSDTASRPSFSPGTGLGARGSGCGRYRSAGGMCKFGGLGRLLCGPIGDGPNHLPFRPEHRNAVVKPDLDALFRTYPHQPLVRYLTRRLGDGDWAEEGRAGDVPPGHATGDDRE